MGARSSYVKLRGTVKPMRKMWTVGVISDTHGLVRPEALAALAGADHIVHAGDVASTQRPRDGEPQLFAAPCTTQSLIARISPLVSGVPMTGIIDPMKHGPDPITLNSR